MSENQAGVYDGLENVNGRLNKLTNEIQGAFDKFYQMIMTEMQSHDPQQWLTTQPLRCCKQGWRDNPERESPPRIPCLPSRI